MGGLEKLKDPEEHDGSYTNMAKLDGKHAWVDRIQPKDTSDVHIIAKSLQQGYPIDLQLRVRIIDKLTEILISDSPRNALSAARALIQADKQNLNIIQTASAVQARLGQQGGDLVERLAEIESNGALRPEIKDTLRYLLMLKAGMTVDIVDAQPEEVDSGPNVGDRLQEIANETPDQGKSL